MGRPIFDIMQMQESAPGRSIDWRDSIVALVLACGGALFVIRVLPALAPHGVGRIAGQWIFDGWLIAIVLFFRFALQRRFAIGAPPLPHSASRAAIPAVAIFVLCMTAIHHLAGVRPIYSNTIAFASDVFTGCSIVPLSEELLFRGLIQTGLSGVLDGSFFGLRSSTMVAASLFGLMHGLNALTSLNTASVAIGVGLATVFGLIAGALYQRTGNLWPSIALHAFANAIGF